MPEYIIKNAKGKEKRFSFPTAEEASDYLAVANEDGLEVDQVVFDTDNSEKRFRVTSFNVDDNGITRATAKGSEGFLAERNPFANVGYGVGQTPMSEAYTEAYSRGAQPSVVENPDRSATIIGNSPKEGETIRVNPDRINRTIEATSDYSQRVGDYLEGKTDVETMAKGATDYTRSMMGGPRLTPEESARMAEDPEYGQVYWNIRHKYGITPEEYEEHQTEKINARIDDALAVAEELRNEAIADQNNWVIDIHGNRYNATDDQLKATIRAIKAVKRDLNDSRTKYGEKDGWHFGKRFWDRGELIVKLTPALNMIRSLESAGVTFAQANAANKMIADPESLTPEQKLLHSLTAIQQSVAQVQEDLGGKHWASGAGEVISEMPEFMMGMPLAKGATKAVTKGATKVLSKVAGKALKETAENATEAAVKTALESATGWQKLGRAVGAWGKSFGEAAIGAPTQTLLYRSLADEALGQYQVRPDGSTIQVITPAWERVYKAWLGTALELHSEDMGMWIGKGLNALGRRMANVGFVRGLMRVPASRSPLLEAVRKELKVADPISEALGEVYGDAIQPLFTGELDWSQTLADPDYWLTTVVASAGVSVAMDVPSGIQYARDGKRINQLGLIMDVSLESIESDDLRKQVIAATSHNSVARQAEALAHIDWSNATREDIAVAMDYVNAYVQREMYYNSWLEMERQEELSREFNNMLATAYRGVSGFDNAMTTIRATAAKGSSLPSGAEYFVISGDVNNPDGFVSVMRIDNGVPTRDFVPVNQLVISEEQDISTQLAKAYDELFSEQIAGEEVSSISRAIAQMRSEGVAEETIREIVSENPSYHEYKEGDVVTDTQTGEAVTINEQTSTGDYIATKANGQRITISYDQIADSGAYAQQAQAESDAAEEGETINFLDADGNTIEGEVSRVHEDGRVDVMVQAGEENGAPAYVGYTILPSQIIRNSEMPAQPTPTEQVAQDVASDVAAVAETTETPQVVAPQAEVTPDAREIPTLEDGSIDYDAIEDPQQFIDLYGKDMTAEELIADVTAFRDDATANTERLNNEVANAKTPNEKKALRDQAKIEANRANKYQAVLDLLMPKAPVAEQTEVAPEVASTEEAAPIEEIAPVVEEVIEPVAEVVEQTPIAEEQMEVVAEQPTEVVAEQTNEETPIKEQVESPVEEAKPTTPAKPKLDISEKENKRRIPLRRRANLWSRKVGVKVVLLESIDEVESKEAQSAIREAEKNNQKVSGWVDEGKVYLYLPHVSNTDEIDATYIHEVVAHIGMEEMMGEKEYQQFCLKVWDMMNEEERDYYYNYEGVRDNKNEEKRKARAADEYIAHLAEQTNLEERDATMWEKIVDLFNELLAKLGYPKNISRLNIEDAIRESYRNLVESNVIIEDQSGAVSRLANKGAVVDAKRGDVKFAVRDILKGEEREQAIKDLMRVTGRNRATVEKYLQAEESLAHIILNDDNVAFLDLQVDESVPAIWDKNTDYPQGTVEFSNICRKRLPFTMIYQQLQGEFPNTVFDAATLETIRGVLKENGVDVACGLCYVEDRRQHLGEIGQGFIDALKGKAVKLNNKQQKAIEELRASGDAYIPTLEELLTLEGMRRLKRNHYGVAVAFIKYNNARGQQAGRLFEAYSAYHREILEWSEAKVDKANRLGGLRIFSYSDFEAHHLIDIIQVLTDCAVKGVKVQAYTKVPEFALVVKDTRMKLNRSLIAKAKGVVDENYIPQENEAVSPNVINGKRLLFDCVEGINVNSENFFDSTSSPTVGNILVGINDEQIHQAMLDPMVDYIIPFHTGIKGEILEQKGIGDWVNYKLSQTEKEVGKNGNLKTAEEQINVYTEVYSDNIRTEKEFVERYLEVCREKGYTPKFSQFLNKNDKGEFVYTKGYYKFLVDFKLFDVDGNILPQEVVVPLFSNEVNKRILDEYVEGEKTKAPTDKVYNEVKEKLREQGTIRYRFIGEKGAANLDKAEEATIRLDNLNTARQMEEAQKSPKTIKMATGWERGADGKWRYEVEDLNIADPTTWVNSRKRLTLEDIIGKNDPLFNEYPNLRTIAIKKSRSNNMGGSYNHANKTITVDVGLIRKGAEIKANPTNFNIGNERIEKIWNDVVRELRGTFVHEIQHAIQRIEGFAVGGNPNMRNPNIPFEEAAERYTEMAAENIKLVRQYNSLSTYERTLPSGVKLRDAIMKGRRQIDKYLKSIRLGNDGYKRLAGEVEARNVERRMDIPLADRYASLASETADVASEDQIILYNAETSEKVYSIGDNEQTPRFRVAPTFYSNAENAVRNIKQEKATPEQWLKMIEKSGGLKAGEDKWLGLSDWLKSSDKKSLTKDEVLDFIKENQTQIEEVHYGEGKLVDTDEFRKLEWEFDDLFSAIFNQRDKDVWAFIREMKSKYGVASAEETFLAMNDKEYNELEALQRLNTSSAIRLEVYKQMVEKRGDEFSEAFGLAEGILSNLKIRDRDRASKYLGLPIIRDILGTRLVYTTNGLENKREIALTIPTIESWGEHDQVHFGDAGEGRAIAWIRFGETTDADGNRVLVIDEVQSKRHQEGRKKGYKRKLANREEAEIAFNSFYFGVIRPKYGNKPFGEWDEADRKEYQRLDRQRVSTSQEWHNKNAVPEAPFEKNWSELAMKRMLRYAAENGFDKVAWTKGDQQNARYSLGQVADFIGAGAWQENIYDFGGEDVEEVKFISIQLRNGGDVQLVVDRNGNILSDTNDQFAGNSLSDVVGKDLAIRLMGEGPVNIDNANIRMIGGDGMRGFYDRMLPAFMNKYGKKWGVKVEDVNLPNLEESAQIMHSVDVTEAMRESVMQGQPMFRITPAMDKAYMDAVERGDMDEAQKMVNVVASAAGYSNDESWKKSHRAPRKSEDNVNPFNTEELVPDDYWAHPEWYTNIRNSAYDRESYYNMANAIRKYKRLVAEGKQEEADKVTVVMYRGVDKTANKREGSFRNGDWITPSRSYAKVSAPYGKSRVIEQEVPLKYIWWDGNSINEWGYDDGANYTYKDTKNNRKLLDAVTYDDNGNVIPLSERFNSRESDIRFRKISATANRNAYNLIRKKLQNAGVKVHEVSEEMVDGAVPLQTPDGTIYGWAVGGEIYLTPQGLNANTAIHEYSHLWVEAMRNMDSRQWSGIKEQLKATPFWQQVLDDPNYENIRENEDAVASEVLARLSGNKGAERLANEAQRIIDAGNGNIMARIESTALVQRVKRLLRDFYAWVARNVFGLTNETTISRVADMVVDDLVNEVHLDNIINSPLEAMFIGENGALNLDIAERVANRVNGLDVAIQMSRDMRSSAEIKLATGWEQGADGAWRYEISDKDVHLNMEAMSELNTIFDKNEYRQRNAERIRMFEESRPYLAEKRRDLIEKYSEKSSIVEAFDDLYGLTPVVAEFKLRDLIDYDEAFDAYPKLGDINVRIIEGMDAQGEHWEGNINLSIETSRIPVRMRAVLLHEIQHAIQGYEGFAVGGSVDSAKKIIDRLERDAQIYEFAQKIKREMERFPESSVSDASLDVVNDMVIAAGKNEEDLIAEGRLDPSIIPFAEHAVNNPAEMERVRDSYNILFTLLGEDGTPIPYKAYKQLMGEVEARNTMTRRNMSAEERAKSLAMYTEDVSRENQILRYRVSGKIESDYPNWLSGTTTESGKHSTQVEGTRKTYSKVGDWIEANLGKKATILDASSGMGYGTADLRARGFNVEDVEPYQSVTRKHNNPATYSSYEDIDKQYDYIISNAVLNVIPDDWRTDLLHTMAQKMKVGGKMFINTRKAGEEKSIKDKIELDTPQEVLVKRNGRIASYQRFFSPSELKAWVQSELGDDYNVEVANKANSNTSGLAAVVVTKVSDSPRYRKVYYDAEGNPVKASPISAPKKKLEKRPFRPDSKAGRAFDALWRAFADSQTIVGEYVDGLLQKIGEKEIQRRQQKAGFGFTKREMESLPARIRNKFRNANPIKAYNNLSKTDQIMVAKVLSKFNPLIDYMSVQNRSESRGEYEMRSYIENHINPLNEARQRLRDVMGVNDLELEAYVSGEHSLERHKSGIDALSVDEEREWSVGKVTKLVDDFHKRLRNNVKRRIAEEGVGFFSREERKAMGIDLYYKMEDAGFNSLSEEEQNKVLEAPLKLMWDRIRALNDTHLGILLRAGRYSKEDIDRIKSHNWKYYVPLYGHDVVFENLSDPTEVYEFAYRGGSPSNNISFKKAEGRSSKAQDIFLNMYQLGQRCIAFEARNNAKRALLDFTRWTNNQLGVMGTRNLWYEKLSYQVKGEDGKWHSTDAIPSRDELAEMRKLNQQIGDYRHAVLNYNNRINSIERLTETPSSQDAADKLDAELRGLQSKREEALRKIKELEEKKTWDVKRSNGFDAESPSTKDKVEADRTIKVWVDGREVRLVFSDPDVARAVNGTKVWAAKGWAAKALSPIAWLTRARAQFNTQFSPDFIISNSLRDFQHALIAMALAEQEDVSISFMKNYVSHIAAAFRSHTGVSTPIPSDVLKKYPIYYSYEAMRSAYLESLKEDPTITEEEFAQGYREMVKANRLYLERKLGKQRVKDTLLEAFRAYGGATGFVHSLNEQAIQKQFREAMLLKNETIVRRYVNPISWARGLANVVSVASEAMEDITRFATFLSHLDSGKSVEEAAQEAKEITTNFNRKGELSSGMGTLYMFFNASIQGSAQVMRLIKQHPRRAMAVMPLYAFLGFAQRITKGMLWKALAFWTIRGLLDDDDELRSIEQLESEVQIPDYIYGDNMIFTLYRTMDALDEVATSGYFFRIPQPNGFRAAYKLGVELGEFALGQQSLAELPLSMASTVAGELIYGYNDTGEIGSDLGRMFIPSPAQPAVDLFLNRDFVNRTIYNERTYKPTAPTYTVAKKGTPQIYVEMSKALNSLLGTDTRSADYNKRWEKRQIRLDIPPEAFEYMVNEMFGGLGTFSNRLMTTVELMFKGEDVPLRKIPFVNRVAGEFEPKNVWPEYKALTDQVDLAWQETAAFRTEEGINMTRKEWKDPSVTYPYMIEHYKDDPNMVEMLRKRWLLKDYFKEVREYSDALKSLGEGGDAVDRASESREMTEQSEKLQADRTLTEKYILEVAKHVDWQAPTNEEVLEQLERVENTIFGD